ncbi:hypothetical protein [Embleya sp. NPDC005575]|uniref:hypothetical protein n=1 Tax=Embleya sp. NPDC005575 TaxID=3156892 RepID=UPI0033ABD301
MANYLPWAVDAAVAEELDQKMGAAVYGDLARGEFQIRDIVDRIGKRELAVMLSGTDDLKSRAYKNMRDNIGRYLRGTRSPRADVRDRIESLCKEVRIQEIRNRSSLRVEINACVITSRTKWCGLIGATLDGSLLDAFADALSAGNPLLAMQVVSDGYGLDPDLVEELASVSSVKIT